MKNILLFFKGALIGFGKIIPGVSGGVIAISLGVYEKAINLFCNFNKNKKESIRFFFFLGMGILISISLISKFILSILDKYFFITMSLFFSLIISSTRYTIDKRNKKHAYIIYLVFLVMIVFSTCISYLNFNLNQKLSPFIYYFIAGFIESITMIIPGISGTAVLMMIGCYEKVINLLSNFTNVYVLADNLSIIVPFIFGIIIGALITIRMINIAFKKYKSVVYNFIIGFSLYTVIYILISMLNSSYSIIDLIIGTIIILVTLFISKKMYKKKNQFKKIC